MKIMAPAGDSDRLDAALKAGADEVYMGLVGYGARRFAKNFSVDEFCAALDKAHRANVSVHLTFNTVMTDAEMERVYPDLKRLYENGLDAAIVQDFGVVSALKEFFPELKLCASTQLSPANSAEIAWFERHGFTRAVLARELSLEEIRSIRKKTSLELEVFVSGALCLGCSGKCYLSSFIGGRSGNRGACAQPCRRRYHAEKIEGTSPGDDFGYGYFLSLRDQLQGRAELTELGDIGVESIKVEGRMKSPEYVYETTRFYRDLVDSISGVSRRTAASRLSTKTTAPARNASDASRVRFDAREEEARRRDVAALFNRGYARGYFREHDPQIANEFYSSNFGVEIGVVRRGGVRLSQPLRNGDGVVFVDDAARKLGGLNVSGIRLVDPISLRKNRVVESAEPDDLVQFHEPIPEGAVYLYRTFDYRLNKEIDAALRQTRRREPVDARLVAKVGLPLELTLTTSRASATSRAEKPTAPAQKKGVDRDSLLDALDRFGETPFYLRATRLEFDPDAFVPKSLLNQLRQEASEKLERAILASYRRVAPERSCSAAPPEPPKPTVRSPASRFDVLSKLAASVRTREQYDACREAGLRKIYRDARPVLFEDCVPEPESSLFASFAGTLADAARLEERGEPYALSWFFNVANARAVRFLGDRFPRADVAYLSPELSDRAVVALIRALGDYPTRRRLTLGLPVYGRLLALHTRKTLFEESRMLLQNEDGRRVVVEREATLPDDFSASRATSTGSSIFLFEPLDLLDAIPWILDSGIGELLLTFTDESAADARAALARALAPSSSRYKTFSYGYTRDAAF